MKKTIILAALLPAISVLAGDLSVDNLTVSSNATIYGKVDVVASGGITNGAVATGGTITTNGIYIIHTFTNVGTANFAVAGGSLVCEVLMVAGGGGGGGYQVGAGGGAGGMSNFSATIAAGTTTVTVGSGGVGVLNSPGTAGGNSTFGTHIATGGGGGGNNMANGGNGGSGGGAGYLYSYGTGISGQGFDGGASSTSAPAYGSGGGGGAGGAGQSGKSTQGGDGGKGESSDISGVKVTYAGGGGGSSYSLGGGPCGAGGDGGGGDASYWHGENGTANTGGGGGGSDRYGDGIGGNGGSGIVIVRYLITTVPALSLSSNGISQTSASGVNVLMGKVGIGTNNPAEQLHVAGNVRVDGTNIVSAIVLGGESRTNWPTGSLSVSNNLSDITNPAAARINLGLGSAATNEAEAFDAAGAANAVSNIFSGQLNAHTTDSNNPHNVTPAQIGALSTSSGALIASSNLADVVNKTIARTNLGLGSAATNDASAFDLAGAAGAVSSTLSAHAANLNNPHQVTASQAGALTPTGNGSQLTDITAAQVGALAVANNLSDVTDKAVVRANLGLGSAATNEVGAFLNPTGNGSQLTGITAAQVGALSTNFLLPQGDLVMGVFTNM